MLGLDFKKAAADFWKGLPLRIITSVAVASGWLALWLALRFAPQLARLGRTPDGKFDYGLAAEQIQRHAPHALSVANEYVADHFGLVFAWGLAGLVIAYVSLRVVVGIFRAIRSHGQIRRIGLIGYFPRPKSGWLGPSINAAYDRVRRAGENDTDGLWILGASGWRTFGAPDAPFHDLVKNYKGKIRIALIHPESPFLELRARSLAKSDDDAGRMEAIIEYRREIEDTLRFVDNIKYSRDVEVRFYNAKPNWKMIIVNSVCWLQYYQLGTHVQDTPAILYTINNTDNCLYRIWSWEFERIFGRCRPRGTPIIDFGKALPAQ